MEITDVRVFLVNEEKLKAFVSIVLDGCFVISDVKIINGPKGLFVSMPSKRRKDGTFRDVAHPLNSSTRNRMEEQILECYRSEVNDVNARKFKVRGTDSVTNDPLSQQETGDKV